MYVFICSACRKSSVSRGTEWLSISVEWVVCAGGWADGWMDCVIGRANFHERHYQQSAPDDYDVRHAINLDSHISADENAHEKRELQE